MNYRPDRLDFEPDNALLRQAIAIATAAHQDTGLPEWSELGSRAERVEGRNKLSKPLKRREQAALLAWAQKDGHLLDSKAFTSAWKTGGKRGETENEVYFDEEAQGWWKRNDLSYHDTYLSFLQRVALHNKTFPEAPLELKGFVADYNRANPERELMLKPVLFQPHVEIEKGNPDQRGATEAEVFRHMTALGYQRIGTHDYYSPDLQIRVEDLHDENVFFKNGELFVIDPVIYLDERGKKRRLQGSVDAISESASPNLLRVLTQGS